MLSRSILFTLENRSFSRTDGTRCTGHMTTLARSSQASLKIWKEVCLFFLQSQGKTDVGWSLTVHLFPVVYAHAPSANLVSLRLLRLILPVKWLTALQVIFKATHNFTDNRICQKWFTTLQLKSKWLNFTTNLVCHVGFTTWRQIISVKWLTNLQLIFSVKWFKTLQLIFFQVTQNFTASLEKKGNSQLYG